MSIAVVVIVVPSKSINLDTEQLAYIEQTAGDQSFSERARELIEMGMEAEDDD